MPRTAAPRQKANAGIQPAAAACLKWIPVGDRLPDDELTVLVAVKDDDEPVWLGFHEDRVWHSATDGAPLGNMVTHWAEIPEAPA